MDQDFYDFFCNLFSDNDEKKIIELLLKNHSDEEILIELLQYRQDKKNV